MKNSRDLHIFTSNYFLDTRIYLNGILDNSSAAAIESDSSDEALAAPQYAVAAAVHNPFGALQQNADGNYHILLCL
jgi:hypothetical protein